MPVALGVVHGTHRPVYGDLQPDELRVGVGEEAALEQRIVREVDAGHEMAGMKRYLLGLGEEVVGVPVQREPPTLGPALAQ